MPVTRRPASLCFPSMLLLPVPIGLSFTGITEALRISKELSRGIEPNLLICSREDMFRAQEILFGAKFDQIKLWGSGAFPSISDIDWCVGNFEAPTFFVGSRVI